MTPITHVFFDINGTLIDGAVSLPLQYARALGRYMAGRYGGQPDEWAAANRRIVDDWDSYYADLDFSADDGLEQMWEGETRTMRALFRLVGRPYPSSDEMARLVREYHHPVTSRCDAFFPDAKEALTTIKEWPLTLGVVTHGMSDHARGLLEGGGVAAWFKGPLITPDVAGQFSKDEAMFRLAFARAGVPAGQCVLVDDSPAATRAAARVGARVILVDRQDQHPAQAGLPVLRDLRPLPDLLRSWMTGDRAES